MRESLTNNLTLKILALVFASFLWLIVVNIDDPVTKRPYPNIKVNITHAEVVTNSGRTYQVEDNTDTITVNVTAKRSVLNSIRPENIVATADMKELSFESQVPISVTITGFEGKYDKDATYTSPKNLQVKIEDNASKKFPIAVDVTGTPREGYVLGDKKVNPEKVTIAGPKSVVNKISRVVAAVNVSGLSEDTTLASQLVCYDASDKAINTTLLTTNLGKKGVSVDITVLQTKSVPLHVDTSAISAIAGYSIGEVICEPKEMLVAGEESALKSIQAIEIPREALILPNLKEQEEEVVDISGYLPPKVKLADENANTVVITIPVEQSGTRTINIPVGSINVINPQAGFKWSYKEADDVQLVIRGSKKNLKKFSLDSSEVRIDLVNYKQAGTYKVPIVVLDLPDGCTLDNEVTVDIILKKD